MMLRQIPLSNTKVNICLSYENISDFIFNINYIIKFIYF